MERKKLAIVSSYHELCGNATYTEVLKNEFSKYYDVDVMALNLKWLGSANHRLQKLAEGHIKEIANRLKGYDYVNIQFEAGLYGTYPGEIIRRIKTLINASNNLIFTMHRVDVRESIFDRKVLKGFLSTSIFANLKRFRRQNYFPIVYRDIIQCLKKQSKTKKIHILVHTKKDSDTVKYVYGFENVCDFPITFLTKAQREIYPRISSRNEFYQKYGIDDEDITIGLFGFIADYKGHDTAIRALKYLPSNYRILVFGSQHPMSIVPYEKINPYIHSLMEMIEKMKLTNRVWFLGSLSDEDFIKALYCCDYSVLPYLETNQGGSGIASLVLETQIKSLFSNNYSFAELSRYFPNCFETFDIGNYQELAYKIEHYDKDYRSNINQCLGKYNIENNILFQKKLFEEEM